MVQIWHFRHICVLLLFALNFAGQKMRFQAFVEVSHTLDCGYNRSDDENDCNGGKGSQRSRSGLVVLSFISGPDADQLKNEICKCGEVHDL